CLRSSIQEKRDPSARSIRGLKDDDDLGYGAIRRRNADASCAFFFAEENSPMTRYASRRLRIRASHSLRRACMGSKRAARRAGIALAAMPIAVSIRTAAAIVTGSRGFSPNSKELAVLLPATVNTIPAATPIAITTETSRMINCTMPEG